MENSLTQYQEIFTPVFTKVGFTPQKTFREGPRFFVVGGDYQGKPTIFKADVEDPKKAKNKAYFHRRAYFKLRREATFLESSNQDFIPRFYGQGEAQEFFWILEELVPGKSQEAGEGSFLFKDEFFTGKNLAACLRILEELHIFSKTNGHPKFEKFKVQFAKRYSLKDYAALLAADKRLFFEEKISQKIDDFIEARHNLFDANQTVITHHEFYAPHIFVNGDEFNVIDWENVGLGNPAHDFTELWFRSFAHPEFQNEIWQEFRRKQPDKQIFDQLFSLEVILQGLGNLKYFATSALIDEKAAAKNISEFTKSYIERVLASDGQF